VFFFCRLILVRILVVVRETLNVSRQKLRQGSEGSGIFIESDKTFHLVFLSYFLLEGVRMSVREFTLDRIILILVLVFRHSHQLANDSTAAQSI
jgi:hypothetical protein